MSSKLPSLHDYPTVSELRAVLNTDKWAVCRKTERNMGRYGRCLTPREFRAVQMKALALRMPPK